MGCSVVGQIKTKKVKAFDQDQPPAWDINNNAPNFDWERYDVQVAEVKITPLGRQSVNKCMGERG